MNGFFNLIKLPGMTSSDAVMAVRRLLPRKTPVGHGGTLDPDAAGILPICVGKATRLFDYIIDKDKTYLGELLLGVSTDTLDVSGHVLTRHDARISAETLSGVLKDFTGEIMQVPPVFSALKQGGEPLYRLARKGLQPELESRPVRIRSMEILYQTAPNRFLLKIVCGKGVYIRSLMRDIGDALGCGGCMSFLLRTQSGALEISNAVTLDELQALDSPFEALLPPDVMLTAYPKTVITTEKRMNIVNGQTIRPEWLITEALPAGTTARLYVGNEFAGMGYVLGDGRMQISAMLLDR